MLNNIFLELLNMSYTASFVIVAVLIARLLLKRAPKVFSYALWVVVLLRLLCPFSLESPISMIPDKDLAASVNIDEINTYQKYQNPSGADNTDDTSNETGVMISKPQSASTTSILWNMIVDLGQYLWLAGIFAVLTYSVISLIKLKCKLIGAGRLRDNIYLADHIASPFVMGLFRPKIYLPSALSQEEQTYILQHEKHHIRRGDHVVKILTFLALCIHWFNPLVWLAFVLSSKDMEMSCDEAVMKKMDGDIRMEYSMSLLSLATGQRIFAGAPLAFGEGDTKSRIKNVMNYKKPAFWVLVICFVTVIALSVILMLNPKQNSNNLLGATYQVEDILFDAPQYSFTYTKETAPFYTITADYAVFEKENTADAEWMHKGGLYPVEYSRQELYALFHPLLYNPPKQLDEVSKVYRADTGDENQKFYLVMQTSLDEILIAVGYDAAENSHVRWLFRMKQISGTYDVDYMNMSIESYLGNDRNIESFSVYETDTAPSYIIVGFLADGSTRKSDMGFATFRFKDGRYRLADCYVYADKAIVNDATPINGSTIQDGIHLAENLAVCYQYGKPSKDPAYEIILSNNPQLTSITRIVDGVQESKETVTGNPSMTVFPLVDLDLRQYEYDYANTSVSSTKQD